MIRGTGERIQIHVPITLNFIYVFVLVNIFGNTLVGNILTKACLHWCHIIVVRMRSYIIVPIDI